MSALQIAERIGLVAAHLDPGAPSTGTHPAADIRPTVRIAWVIIFLFFGLFGLWLTFAPLAGAVVASGTIKVDLNRKTIQHLEGGIIKDIKVRDGAHVKAGDVLVVIEDKRVDATVEVLQGQLDAEHAKAARLTAERHLSADLKFPDYLVARSTDPQVAELMESERTFFNTRRDALQQQLRLLEQQMGEARNEIASLRDRAEAEEAGAKLLAEEVAANESIEKSQYVPKMHVLSLKRGIEDYRARRGEHLANIAQTQQKITDLELRTVSIKDQYVEAAAEELTAVNAKIFDLEERLRPSEDAQRRQQVITPINGTVVDLKVFTIGGSVGPREPLLDIVPDDNPLMVEAEIPVDSIDDVHFGQAAEIRLSAYKRRSTPLVAGKVIYVSADRLTDRTGERSFYLARIEVDRKSLAEAGDLEMFPGMPAEVFIRTDERTALDYLLAPVTQSMRRGFREP